MSGSFQNMRLDGILMTQLYGHCLNEGRNKAVAEISALPYLGGNTKKITILVNNPEDIFLSDKELDFLTKILSACGLDMGDIAIVNMAKGIPLAEVYAQLAPEKTISFGNIPGMSATPFFNIESRQGIPLLSSPDLKILSQDSEETRSQKNELWKSLKQLFGIN